MKKLGIALSCAALTLCLTGCSTGYMIPREAAEEFDWLDSEVLTYAVEECAPHEVLDRVAQEYGDDAIVEYAASRYWESMIDALVDEYGSDNVIEYIYDNY